MLPLELQYGYFACDTPLPTGVPPWCQALASRSSHHPFCVHSGHVFRFDGGDEPAYGSEIAGQFGLVRACPVPPPPQLPPPPDPPPGQVLAAPPQPIGA